MGQLKRSSFLFPSEGLSLLRSTMSAEMMISSTSWGVSTRISIRVVGSRNDIDPGGCADAGTSFAIGICSGSFSW